ncbi:hypothetical protein ANANG_G00260860 [Anguilla anguilla]|uniref:Uncharacterized protein n=1 Tax=Anguilla anguilla TaxID=7936 RepID=A0A9D3RLB3_ANGAN|nr:hypothetical protein ANANG_G00260860 [Anguilla anguilla]
MHLINDSFQRTVFQRHKFLQKEKNGCDPSAAAPQPQISRQACVVLVMTVGHAAMGCAVSPACAAPLPAIWTSAACAASTWPYAACTGPSTTSRAPCAMTGLPIPSVWSAQSAS